VTFVALYRGRFWRETGAVIGKHQRLRLMASPERARDIAAGSNPGSATVLDWAISGFCSAL
jgi:hypothetical protein